MNMTHATELLKSAQIYFTKKICVNIAEQLAICVRIQGKQVIVSMIIVDLISNLQMFLRPLLNSMMFCAIEHIDEYVESVSPIRFLTSQIS